MINWRVWGEWGGGEFVPLGDMWQCLDTCLIFTTGGRVLLASNGQTRDAAKRPIMHESVAYSTELFHPKCQYCPSWETWKASPQLILFLCTRIYLVNLVMELLLDLWAVYIFHVFLSGKSYFKQDIFVLSCFSIQFWACPVFNFWVFFKWHRYLQRAYIV